MRMDLPSITQEAEAGAILSLETAGPVFLIQASPAPQASLGKQPRVRGGQDLGFLCPPIILPTASSLPSPLALLVRSQDRLSSWRFHVLVEFPKAL